MEATARTFIPGSLGLLDLCVHFLDAIQLHNQLPRVVSASPVTAFAYAHLSLSSYNAGDRSFPDSSVSLLAQARVYLEFLDSLRRGPRRACSRWDMVSSEPAVVHPGNAEAHSSALHLHLPLMHSYYSLRYSTFTKWRDILDTRSCSYCSRLTPIVRLPWPPLPTWTERQLEIVLRAFQSRPAEAQEACRRDDILQSLGPRNAALGPRDRGRAKPTGSAFLYLLFQSMCVSTLFSSHPVPPTTVPR
ncbi:hypothetical protein EDB87DRAFT_1025393 [Lactarius vividus]|nr:hypothetical protein EDB87DRAFT_1025393 [Lactarius vividus]